MKRSLFRCHSEYCFYTAFCWERWLSVDALLSQEPLPGIHFTVVGVAEAVVAAAPAARDVITSRRPQ